ncbi:unnamed protein product [Amoebophrya sp. A120]|nr:unnamed protein product [Amoebophrya sp. A120]|eukprot:GSA120T00009839001.1
MKIGILYFIPKFRRLTWKNPKLLEVGTITQVLPERGDSSISLPKLYQSIIKKTQCILLAADANRPLLDLPFKCFFFSTIFHKREDFSLLCRIDFSQGFARTFFRHNFSH